MFALSRHCSRASARLFSRNFAEVVTNPTANAIDTPPEPQTPSNASQSSSPQIVSPTRLGNRVSVQEDHGLYGFFRKKEQGKDKNTYVGEAQYETIGGSMYQENVQSGRSWKASELRLKSFHDLHTLWYVLLRERNLLATQKEEVRRLGTPPVLFSLSYKVRQCQKSMARIKYVLNERRLAYEGAVELAAKEKEAHLDQVVLQHQRAEYRKERKFLAKRQAKQADGTWQPEHTQDSEATSAAQTASPASAASAGIFGQKQ